MSKQTWILSFSEAEYESKVLNKLNFSATPSLFSLLQVCFHEAMLSCSRFPLSLAVVRKSFVKTAVVTLSFTAGLARK
jgi:hypothetical protein